MLLPDSLVCSIIELSSYRCIDADAFANLIKIFMGEAHSFVSFFASFFLKTEIGIFHQNAYPHCILLNKSVVMM